MNLIGSKNESLIREVVSPVLFVYIQKKDITLDLLRVYTDFLETEENKFFLNATFLSSKHKNCTVAINYVHTNLSETTECGTSSQSNGLAKICK